MTTRPEIRSRRTLALAAAAVALVGVLVLAWLFQPWRLVTDRTVAEAVPVVAATSGGGGSTQPDPPASTPAPEPETQPTELATGELVTHEHTISGTVRLLELADGSRVLRIEGLDTSDGPDVRVWLTDAPLVEGRDGWFVFDDGAYLDLGPLKGNRGDANYPVPADADVTTLTSVSLWCRRFSVSFGAAALT